MTAVAWLTELLMEGYTIDNKIIQQALEMEKQQIIDAFEDGYGSGYRDNGKLGSEYYDETFKNNKS